MVLLESVTNGKLRRSHRRRNVHRLCASPDRQLHAVVSQKSVRPDDEQRTQIQHTTVTAIKGICFKGQHALQDFYSLSMIYCLNENNRRIPQPNCTTCVTQSRTQSSKNTEIARLRRQLMGCDEFSKCGLNQGSPRPDLTFSVV